MKLNNSGDKFEVTNNNIPLNFGHKKNSLSMEINFFLGTLNLIIYCKVTVYFD